MPAPVASGWSDRRVGLAPTGKAPPCHGARGSQFIWNEVGCRPEGTWTEGDTEFEEIYIRARVREDAMKRNGVPSGLLIIVAMCSLLPGAAHGQFTEQGPKLVGTGAIGTRSKAGLSRFPVTGIPSSWAGPPDDNQGAAWVFTQPVFAGTPG